MEIVKELKPLAGGNMGSGGGSKKPPTTPNDRDNSSGDWREPQRWDSSNHQRFEQEQNQAKMWKEINNPHRYMSPRQDHFRTGHAESKPADNYYDEQGRMW